MGDMKQVKLARVVDECHDEQRRRLHDDPRLAHRHAKAPPAAYMAPVRRTEHETHKHEHERGHGEEGGERKRVPRMVERRRRRVHGPSRAGARETRSGNPKGGNTEEMENEEEAQPGAEAGTAREGEVWGATLFK